ncbi:IclR family transcriptional regulator [Bosea psychrotolerans]|uniref:IclR family transcriptional regulator n=1 Tax=Bosea psychrotolerans TaxID=1871628 RepID=A0A2S4MBS7_9HYPH|nr:IclR family transcriptional regulator [Bosea psychrotolerans]POR51947.1 IclR family transcriptional regulator [Bosea psychrotolerans]
MATPTNQSIVKAFDIIAIVCASAQSRSLRELAAEADLSLASTHRILGTLKSVGAVRLTRNGGYELGAMIASLRKRDLQCQQDMRAEIQHEINELHRDLGSKVTLAALNRSTFMLTVAESGACGVSEIGNSYEPYFSAPGKMLLAGLSSNLLSEYIAEAPFAALTPGTIVAPAQLASEIRQIRRCGYATDNEEYREGTRGVAVGLRDRACASIGALSVSDSASRLPQRATLEIVGRLKETARAIEQTLARSAKFGDILTLYSED